MRITTRKLAPGRYAVLANGLPTSLVILKSTPAKFRCPQEWDVCSGPGELYLYSCKGLHVCVWAIKKTLALFNN